MLCIALQFHHNILSSQGYIRYVDDSNSINTIQVECSSSELELLLLLNEEIVKKVKIFTPDDLFIPLSLSSDSESSIKSGSTIVCRATLAPTGQFVAECSFRLQISGADKLDHSESELKVDVKNFFKERFKNSAYWNLCCASCGVGLPLEPVFIECVQEYSESELSEGWFCHGNGPQPAFQPSSQILYLDDTSFYLNTRLDSDKSCKGTMIVDKKGCFSHDTGCQKDSNLPNVCHSDSSGINCSSESAGDCCDSENINQGFNTYDFSIVNLTNGQQHNHLTIPNLSCLDVKNKTDLDRQVLCNHIVPNLNSSFLNKDSSSVRTSMHLNCDCKHSAIDKKECLNGSKVLHSAVECQSCGDILTTEKSLLPFLRFYLDKLMFKNSSFNDDHVEYAHEIRLLSFWSLVTRSQTSLLPSKIFFQSKVLCLLLWIPSAPVAQFLLRGALEDVPPEIRLQTESAYKVLYFVGTDRSEPVRSWSRDFGVDFYRVSDSMVRTLVRILEDSSRDLPETDGNGFSCGFLRPPSRVS